MDWHELDTAQLFETIRSRGPADDAERTVLAFERALELARVDAVLLDHLVVAAACLLAHARDQTPRTVLEHVFRRSVSDADWRERYAPLFG